MPLSVAAGPTVPPVPPEARTALSAPPASIATPSTRELFASTTTAPEPVSSRVIRGAVPAGTPKSGRPVPAPISDWPAIRSMGSVIG